VAVALVPWLVALLSGCMVGPNYQTPQLPVPDAFTNQAQEGLSTERIETLWWRGFQDDRLNQLVELALAQNHDLRVATARLREARALRAETEFDRYPTVTAQGSYMRERLSEIQTVPGADRDVELYDAGFDAIWELDFFGRVRARIRGADARTEAALAQYEERVLLALEETENALVDFTRQQARRDLLRASAQASEKAQNLARQRYQFGMTDFLTVLDAERTLLDAQDRLADSETRTATALVAVYKALGGGWEIASQSAGSNTP
jgi:multidrug efflux system outer membrane protein